jgi:NADPH-dependent curcumin reductase CurA
MGLPSLPPDESVETYLLARVQKSNNLSFHVNDLVHGLLPLQEYTSVSGKTARRLEIIHNPRGLEENLFLGALGMPGLTAYSSLYAIDKPKRGETIFISSAAGAVGQIAGQLAKLEGLTVIGSVGSCEKLKFIVDNLGFDGGFNYKRETAAEALPRLAPQGLDIYYDNVGGEQLEAALLNMKMKGRISKYFASLHLILEC